MSFIPSPTEFLKARDQRKTEQDELQQVMAVIGRAMKSGRTSVTLPSPQHEGLRDDISEKLQHAGYTSTIADSGANFMTVNWHVQDMEQ